MNVRFLSILLLLAGCNTPSIGFMGVEATTVTVEQSTFDVRQRDGQAELIRTNTERAFSLRQVIPRASKAVVLATGCSPIPGTWSGDQAVMRVDLDC